MKQLKQSQNEFVTSLLNALEKKTIPWRAGWDQGIYKPYNATSNAKYQGMNQLSLWMTSLARGYDDPRWMTFKQAKEKGYRIIKGSAGTAITSYILRHMETKKYVSFEEYNELSKDEKAFVKPVYKTYYVFHASQIDGIPKLEVSHIKWQNEKAETFSQQALEHMKLHVEYGGAKAAYQINDDNLLMPNKETFFTEEDYYATLLHEVAHATSHESRLHRELQIDDQKAYAKEELRAELTAAFLSMDIGFHMSEFHQQQHEAYIASWYQLIKDDPNVIYEMISDAKKIQEYILEQGDYQSIYQEEHQLHQEVSTEHVINQERISEHITLEDKQEELGYSTDYILLDYQDIDLGSYFEHQEAALYLDTLGVQIGYTALRTDAGKVLSREEVRQLGDPPGEAMNLTDVFVPLRNLEELAEYELEQRSNKYIISPLEMSVIEAKQFNYMFRCLTRPNFMMFDINEINLIQARMITESPMSYEKMMKYRDQYITQEKIEQMSNETKVDQSKIKELLGISKELDITSTFKVLEGNQEVSNEHVVNQESMSEQITLEDKQEVSNGNVINQESMSEQIFRKIVNSYPTHEEIVVTTGGHPVAVFDDPANAKRYISFHHALEEEIQQMKAKEDYEVYFKNIGLDDQEYAFLKEHYNVSNEPRVFIDMDGVLAVFNNNLPSLDVLYQQGYFASLEPQESVVNTVRDIIKEHPNQVYVLSAALDSPYAIEEKKAWLHEHIPELQEDHMIFSKYGKNKADFIPNGITSKDILLDDYTKNLDEWSLAGGQGIKLLNGINDTNQTWNGPRIDLENIHTIQSVLFTEEVIQSVKQEIPIVEKGPDKKINQQVDLQLMKDSISIVDYARDVIGLHVVKEGKGLFRLEEHDSCKIYPNNSFYRYSSDVGGSIIDFIKHFEEVDTKGAIENMKAYYAEHHPDIKFDSSTQVVKPRNDIKGIVMPEKAETNKHIYAYLTKTRGIQPSIVTEMIDQKLLYEDVQKNCVFVGKFEGSIQYASLRGSSSNSKFKQDAKGSIKEVGIYVDNKSSILVVNEAVIDSMSYMSLADEPNKYNYLSVNGAANCESAVKFHMKKREEAKEVKHIVLALDNDEAGEKNMKKTLQYLKENYPGVEVSIHLPVGKDFNEQLMNERQLVNEFAPVKNASLELA